MSNSNQQVPHGGSGTVKIGTPYPEPNRDNQFVVFQPGQNNTGNQIIFPQPPNGFHPQGYYSQGWQYGYPSSMTIIFGPPMAPMAPSQQHPQQQGAHYPGPVGISLNGAAPPTSTGNPSQAPNNASRQPINTYQKPNPAGPNSSTQAMPYATAPGNPMAQPQQRGPTQVKFEEKGPINVQSQQQGPPKPEAPNGGSTKTPRSSLDPTWAKNLQLNLRQLGSSELREIILSLSMRDMAIRNGATRRAKDMVDMKDETISASGGSDFGLILQHFNAEELESLIFYICENVKMPVRTYVQEIVMTMRRRRS